MLQNQINCCCRRYVVFCDDGRRNRWRFLDDDLGHVILFALHSLNPFSQTNGSVFTSYKHPNTRVR
jgi:hypothetical protein